jgi:hypothetical protein
VRTRIKESAPKAFTALSPRKQSLKEQANTKQAKGEEALLVCSLHLRSLLKITICLRPDVAASAGALSRFSNSPGAMQVRACKRVALYLYNTRRYGIVYQRADEHNTVPLIYAGAQRPFSNGTNLVKVFAGSIYAGDDTCRSTKGAVPMINGGPIS